MQKLDLRWLGKKFQEAILNICKIFKITQKPIVSKFWKIAVLFLYKAISESLKIKKIMVAIKKNKQKMNFSYKNI